jgi:hypothetical protein
MAIESSWTIKDLHALEQAIAKGVLRVKYTDKEIEYRSLQDMFALRDRLKKELGEKRSMTSVTVIASKGLCD